MSCNRIQYANSVNLPLTLDVRKIYVDHDNAPSNIMISPLLIPGAASSNASDDDVEIRKRPNSATPHPPHTERLILSPEKDDMMGVIITLVCVRKDARAAGL